jgi:hypothetical protein
LHGKKFVLIFAAKKIQMKLFKLCLLMFLFAAFSACENHMDIRDVTKGTPSNADTVLPAKHAPAKTDAQREAYKESLPRVYWR